MSRSCLSTLFEGGHAIVPVVVADGARPELRRDHPERHAARHRRPAPEGHHSRNLQDLRLPAREAQLFMELIDKDAKPRYRQSLGHNHVSQLLSVGTADTSVSREVLDFIDRTVGR